MCPYAFFLFVSEKSIVAVGKKNKVTTTKEQRTAQAGCTTTRTERRAHRTAQLYSSQDPAACIYFGAFRRMRFTGCILPQYRASFSVSTGF